MTWLQLMNSIQSAYEKSVGWVPGQITAQTDENGFRIDAEIPRPSRFARWYDENGFSHDDISDVTLPGFSGTWQYILSARGEMFIQPTPNAAWDRVWRVVRKGPDGNVQSGTFVSPESGGVWSALGGFVMDVLPIVATVGSVFVAGAGIEALGTTAIGEGAAVGTAEAGAGWVSAEGGAAYAGGMAADAIAPAVIGGAETFAVAAPEVVTVSTLPEAGAGWVSAEGGASYAGGMAADAAIAPAVLPSAGGLLDKITSLTPADILKYGGQVSTAVKTVQSAIGKPATPPRYVPPAAAAQPAQSSSTPILVALAGVAAFLFL